jgi:hypothetical protein
VRFDLAGALTGAIVERAVEVAVASGESGASSSVLPLAAATCMWVC